MTSRRNPLAVGILTSLALLAAAPVFAQSTSTSTSSSDDKKTEEAKSVGKVTVVGSRIKRAKVEGPAPVTVVTRTEMEREGLNTVADMLQTLNQGTSQNFTGDLAVTGFTPNAQVINLRALGPGYTLTLVDGRRPAQYPQPYNNSNNIVNVRAIPSAIIERTEVLAGGASAIYGSDAVAGVVNIVTRKNFDGNTLRLRVGTTEEGGGDNYNVEYSGGKVGDSWNALWAFQTGKTWPVFGSDREFLSDTRKGPLGLLTAPSLALVAIRGNSVGTGVGQRVNQNAYYPGQAVCDAFGYTNWTNTTRGNFCGEFTRPGSRSISNLYNYGSMYGRVEKKLTDSTSLWVSSTFYKSKAASSGGSEFWATSSDQFMKSSSGGSTNGYYYDPSFGGLITLQRTFNPWELGGADAVTTRYDEKTWDITAGLTGTFADRFDWDLTGQYSRYEYQSDMPRLLSKGMHDLFLGKQNGFFSGYPVYTLNRAEWTRPWTAADYAAHSTRVINEAATTSQSLQLTTSGDLMQLPAGALGFAGVIEAVRQTVDLKSDPRTDQLRPLDEQTIYNLSSSGRTQGTRDRFAIGAELRVPLTKNVTGQVAGRYDKYNDASDIGGAFTYNLGLEYRPVDTFLMRASYATSFRAPDMQMVYAKGAASYSTILDEYACYSGTGVAADLGKRTYDKCNASGDPTIYTSQTLVAGNKGLREERGKSLTTGFVWDVADGINLSLDYYRIQLTDAASQLSSGTILEAEAACRMGGYMDSRPAPTPAYCEQILSFVVRGSDPQTRIQRINSAYINTAMSDTSGIDGTLNFRTDWGQYGRLRYGIGYTLVLTDKYKENVEDDLIDYRDTYTYQRSRVRGNISYSRNDWTFTLLGTRLGSIFSAARANGTNAAGTPFHWRLPAWTTYNLTVDRRINPNMSLNFAIINLTNSQYREDPSQTGYPFFNGYKGADPLGRRYNITLTYKF